MENSQKINSNNTVSLNCDYFGVDQVILEKHIYNLVKNNQVTCHKCCNKMKCTPSLHTTRHGFLCTACTQRIDASMEHCKFHSFGCDYANDDQWIRRKHEEWMCQFNDKDCWKCRMKYLHTRQIDHWSQNHCKLLTAMVNNNVANVSYSGIKHGECHFTVNTHNEFFYIQLAFTAHNISVWMVMDSHEHSDKRFTCDYTISFPAEDVVFKREIPKNESFGFDWFDVLPIDAKMSDRIDLQLSITKKPN